MITKVSPIIVALDYSDTNQALNLVDQLDPIRCQVKVGKELFTLAGPQLINALIDRGFKVFLDLKFHDIPNTVARACAIAADLGIWMINVHALGGKAMLIAARESLAQYSQAPLLTAVSLLTSMDSTTLEQIGLSGSIEENGLRLAQLVYEARLDGIICSGLEVPLFRQSFGKNFLLVTPGVRPIGTEAGDQKRVLTPKQAMTNGSDYLVIGRPITQAKHPMLALEAIELEINEEKAMNNEERL
ncbi:orotidine-5'-phosphate decarboxylase [Candidatus Nitrosacidococcus tergens]|uniref:Orotidine 5'-phosphate decarboxylase n=1 Tax=Candidatus Nitrosacidococcus tergens TaxID=553981 RepID=A0A7G1Q835_9GAMM|nr:orotidine-5'-phosphate decarboxylase [Candidatus Nitrosacidococcus tergens]CAB1274748.1 orotidine-5'-phosphate decarboxylase [Candidatus Nitrosacidococcus tergens]